MFGLPGIREVDGIRNGDKRRDTCGTRETRQQPSAKFPGMVKCLFDSGFCRGLERVLDH